MPPEQPVPLNHHAAELMQGQVLLRLGGDHRHHETLLERNYGLLREIRDRHHEAERIVSETLIRLGNDHQHAELLLERNHTLLVEIRDLLRELVAARPQPSGCLRDIQIVLRQAGHRLTTLGVLSALAHAGLEWGESTVKATLSAAVDAGHLTNDQKANPKGYGLPS